MSDRQYGLPSDYQRGNRTQVPAQSRQLPSYPAPSQTSPTRKPLAPYSDNFTPPPPPPHGNHSPSPKRYRQQQSPTRNQNIYSGLSTAAGAGAGFAATAPAYSQPHAQSGDQPFREINNLQGSRGMTPSPDFDSDIYDNRYEPTNAHRQQQGYSQSSIAPLSSHAQGMAGNGNSPPRGGPPAPGMLAYGYGYDSNMPSSRSWRSDGYDAYVDPRDIADDADDGFEDQSPRRNHGAAGAGAGAGIAGVPSMLKAFGSRDTSGNYGQVPTGRGSRGSGDVEKSDWLKQNGHNRSKKLKYIFGGLGILIIIGIIAGVVGGIVATNPSSSGSGGSSSPSKVPNDGKYNINSPEVKALLNNKNLHKVFPAMDYTPLNGQYPACLTVPVNQDNVTLDIAVLSQLTPAIRLYGTDCDQTEAVLTAIEKLEMEDKVKVWLGVWLDSNSTSNNRQMNQMYEILDKYDQSRFAGIIIGNEVLFREDMTEAQLGSVLAEARTKISGKGIDLPVSTSDLGDNWTAALAADSDIVMANVHPFFAGVKPTAAPGWTWSFWTTHDENLAKSTGGKYPKSIISETGWPSQGGNDCGTGYKCPSKTDGAIAGIDEMNTFMDGWVCQSIANGTTYFWFEAIDEPWKAIFNTPKTGDMWEPHWGLLDVNRNLKDGLKIPDCGGKTLDGPYVPN